MTEEMKVVEVPGKRALVDMIKGKEEEKEKVVSGKPILLDVLEAHGQADILTIAAKKLLPNQYLPITPWLMIEKTGKHSRYRSMIVDATNKGFLTGSKPAFLTQDGHELLLREDRPVELMDSLDKLGRLNKHIHTKMQQAIKEL